MKILIITTQIPDPPASGGALRVFGIIRGLHEAGHQITLMSVANPTELHDAKQITAICERIVTVPPAPPRTVTRRLRDLALTRQPDIAFRFYDPAFEARLRELLAEVTFDLIQIEAIEAACYLPVVKNALVRTAQTGTKVVFDTFNAEYQLQRVIASIDRRELKRLPAAIYSLIQTRRLKRYEAEMCRIADAVIAVSPEDAEALRSLFHSDGKVFIVPSGITVKDYTKPDETLTLHANSLIFTGKMDYRPNIDAMLWFADEIFPLIQQQMPDIHVYIVGQQPHARLDRLRSLHAMTLTGRVESVIPYLHAGAVYIAPLRMGSGTRLKLLEAMASGCAIVATTTASAGLLDEAKQAMKIADDPQIFAQAVVELLRDRDQRQAAGVQAYEQVSAHYDWSKLIPKLLNTYREIGLES